MAEDAHQQLEDSLLRPGDVAAALDAIRRGADVRQPFLDGSAPLTWAVSGSLGPEGSARCVRAMLDAGATVADEPWKEWGTSVHRAAELGYTDALKLLLEADGKAALERFDELSQSPLIRAIEGGSIAAVEMLLEAGADVNGTDEPRIGNPPLRWATEARNEKMIEVLLAAGADPLKPGWMQLSAFHIAQGWKDSRTPELVRIFELLDRVTRHPEARHSPGRSRAKPRRGRK
jgi:ankyrin repeat protein